MTLRRVLVEISVTEQRYQAVLDVRAGSTVTDVAARFGVSRQAVHRWLSWYEQDGLAGLADRSSRPLSSPAQTAPEVEALICELRRKHPRWCHRRRGAEGHRPCGLPRPGGSSARIWHPGRATHRQRQTVHRPVQRPWRRSDVRPDLPGERHHPPPHETPLTQAELGRIRDARPAGPAPAPPARPLRVDRRVSSRGSSSIARQRMQVGIGHAGRTVTVEEADTTFRVHDGDQLLTEVIRTTTKRTARCKARKPEPPRHAGR